MTTLLLLPGMDGTGTLFAPLVEALAGAVRIQVVRYPSATVDGNASLVGLVEAQLPVEGPVVLLGESFSGPIAIALAAKHPERIAGLVLCCTFARNPYPALSVLGGLTGMAPMGLSRTRLAATALLGRFATPRLRADLEAALAAVSNATLPARLRAVLTVDVSADLARVSAPILYLRAREDRVVPRSAGDFVRSIRPSTRTVEIRGPHCLLQVAPTEAAKVIEQFACMIE